MNTVKKQPRRAAISGFLGTAIDYYDFFIYGTFAALLFNQIFFDNLPPLIGSIAALATLAAGYLSRFAGALLFGHFGDRLGRKKILTLTLVVTGMASGLIGLLPTQAQIGVAAPLLLLTLRIIQGIAVGGEFGGAVLMSAEHSDNKRRGLTASSAALGASVGGLVASATTIGLSVALSPEDLLAWGWRLPFIFSFLLLAVGLYIRIGVNESPVFSSQNADEIKKRKAPAIELITTQKSSVARGITLQLSGLVGQGIFVIYLTTYATQVVQYTTTQVLVASLVGAITMSIMTPFYGYLSDLVGRRKIISMGAIFTIAAAFPMFWVINQKNFPMLLVAVFVYTAIAICSTTALAPVVLSELFPTSIRYTGVSTTYQLAVTLGPGLMPMTAAALLALRGDSFYISILLIITGVITLIATRTFTEFGGKDLNGEENRTPMQETSKNRT